MVLTLYPLENVLSQISERFDFNLALTTFYSLQTGNIDGLHPACGRHVPGPEAAFLPIETDICVFHLARPPDDLLLLQCRIESAVASEIKTVSQLHGRLTG